MAFMFLKRTNKKNEVKMKMYINQELIDIPTILGVSIEEIENPEKRFNKNNKKIGFTLFSNKNQEVLSHPDFQSCIDILQNPKLRKLYIRLYKEEQKKKKTPEINKIERLEDSVIQKQEFVPFTKEQDIKEELNNVIQIPIERLPKKDNSSQNIYLNQQNITPPIPLKPVTKTNTQIEKDSGPQFMSIENKQTKLNRLLSEKKILLNQIEIVYIKLFPEIKKIDDEIKSLYKILNNPLQSKNYNQQKLLLEIERLKTIKIKLMNQYKEQANKNPTIINIKKDIFEIDIRILGIVNPQKVTQITIKDSNNERKVL